MQQRLFEIIWHLMHHRGATAQELADRFCVSRRTIYRDVDALSSAGIPIYAEKGKGGGIRLLDNFVLDKTLFSKEEQAQLVSHFESLAAVGTPDAAPVLEKLAALFGRHDAWLEINFVPWSDEQNAHKLFDDLKNAILNRNTVLLEYVGEREVQKRAIDPYKLVFRGQGWYLHGYCHMREDFRFFKLNRIQSLVITPEIYTPMEEPPSTSAMSATPMLPVKIRFAPGSAYRVMDEFPRAGTTTLADGSIVVECPFPPGEWLTGYLLSFGPSAEVLEPQYLRDAIKNKLSSMLDSYSE